MIFPTGYSPYLDEEQLIWLKARKIKYRHGWNFHDDNYILVIHDEEDAIAFKLTFGMKSGRTGFIFHDVK
jgi:hypothetical protein